MTKLDEQALKTIGKMASRFVLVQPDGSIKRRGAWCFHVQANAVKAAAEQPDVQVYDKLDAKFLETGEVMSTAVIPAVELAAPVEPLGQTGPDTTEGAIAAQNAVAAVVDAEGQDAPTEPVAPVEVPDTRILDSVIETLSNGKPRGERKVRRGAKDGKPKALSAKGAAQTRAGVKVTDKPKAKKAKAKVDRGVVIRKANGRRT